MPISDRLKKTVMRMTIFGIISLSFLFLSQFSNIFTSSVLAASLPLYNWTITTDLKAIGNSVTTDASGNIYVTGTFQGTVDFDSGIGTDSKTSAGSNDIFLTKINADESYGWTKTMGGISSDSPYKIIVDTSGNIYITGFFQDTVDFDPGANIDSKTSVGSEDIFLTKINADTSYGWTKTIGSTSHDGSWGLDVDASGNIYVTGYFTLTVDFDPGIGVDNKISVGNTDMFLTKINADGSYGGTRAMGGTNADDSYVVTIDNLGNIYMTGVFRNTVDFDPGAGFDNKTSVGIYDIFVTKFNADTTYGWTKTMGSISSDGGWGLEVDASGNIYIGGYFYSTVDFDPGIGIDSKTPVGLNDIFITKFYSDGSYGWTRTMGGTSYDGGYATALDSLGNIYVTGYFALTVDFDAGIGTDSITENSVWGASMFITSYDPNGNYLWARTSSGGNMSDSYAMTIDTNNNIYVTGDIFGTVDYDVQGSHDWITVDPNIGAMFLTKYNINFVPPILSSFSPLSQSKILDSTPTISFETDENATCRLSLSDESYDDMSDDVICTGEGTTSQSCISPDLGLDGEKSIYIACIDEYNNKDSTDTNEHLSYTLDTIAPTSGSLLINEGDIYTNSQNIILALYATDMTTTVVEMMISESSSFTGANWETYAISKDWSLSSGDGEKTVYIKFRDAASNESTTYSDTIILDANPPSDELSINGGDTYTDSLEVTLDISATDVISDVVEMIVSEDENFTGASWETYVITKDWTLSDGDGEKTIYTKF